MSGAVLQYGATFAAIAITSAIATALIARNFFKDAYESRRPRKESRASDKQSSKRDPQDPSARME